MADDQCVVTRTHTHTLRIRWPIVDELEFQFMPARAMRVARSEVRAIADEFQATVVGAGKFERLGNELVFEAPAVLRVRRKAA